MGAILMAEKANDELLNVPQVAKLLDVSRPKVYELMAQGFLVPATPDNPLLRKQHRKFRRADVERLKREGLPPAESVN